MLVDFTVANYRSIREPVTLSAVAATGGPGKPRQGTGRRRLRTDEEIAPAYAIEGRGFSLLPVLGIFGANASGKTNVLRAFDTLIELLCGGTTTEGLVSGVLPFGLNRAWGSRPTEFTIRTQFGGTIYDYTLRTDRKHVLLETLSYLPPPPARHRLLFERSARADGGFDWTNGPDFAGPHESLETTIRGDQPFFSLFTRHLSVDVVAPLARWLLPGPRLLVASSTPALLAALAGTASLGPFAASLTLRFLRTFGLDIDEVYFPESKVGEVVDSWGILVRRNTSAGPISWPLALESAGTQRLTGLAGYLTHAILNGGLVLLDELEASLHPHLTRRIIRMFQSPEENPRRAQLIFTSHDSGLQRELRRDQIWLTQKRHDGSTELFSVSDFRPRNDLAIDRAYLDGRFGAVPILGPEEPLAPVGAPER